MRTRESPTPAATAHALGTTLAGLSPLLAMLAAGAAHAPCAGGDRLVSAALALTPAQAPGAPIATLIAYTATWLPLGSLPLRISLATSALAAVAAAALYRAIDASSRAGAGEQPRPLYIAGPFALAFIWFAFGCDGAFVAEARADVAGVALACLCLERLATQQASAANRDDRSLLGAGCWLGLLLIEQPLLGSSVWLAALPVLNQVQHRARFYAVVASSAAALALGLTLLAARDPALSQAPLAATAHLLAEAFAVDRTQSLAARLGAFALPEWLLLGFALLSSARAARAQRRAALLPWAIVTLAALGAGLLLAHAAALHMLALCGAAAIGALTLTDVFEAGVPRRLAFALALLAIALGGALLRATALQHMQHEARAIDVLREPLLRELPARATLLVDQELLRALRDAELEERVRPDVLVAQKPWRLDLAASAALAHTAPELQPALRSYLLEGGLPLSELRSLAARQPVLIELSTSADERVLTPALLPFGLYHQVSTSTATRNDARFAARDADASLLPLSALLEADAQGLGCRTLLLDRAAAAADYYEQVKDPEHAQAARAWGARFATPP